MTTLRVNVYRSAYIQSTNYGAWEYTLYNWTRYLGRAVIQDPGYTGHSLPYVDGISLEEQYRGRGYGTWRMELRINEHLAA